MNNTEKGIFLKLYNRNGYVLDFSTVDFDAFTMRSVGISLCAEYGLSKGRSLITFVNNSTRELSNKLLLDLLEYYETQYYDFENEQQGTYGRFYAECKNIAQRINKNQFTIFASNSVKEVFSSEYIEKQTSIMIENQKNNPTESIGKAKELIESCCKTILEENKITIESKWNINNLVDETTKLLEITPKHISDTTKEAEAIKAILGNLKGIASNIAIIRNAYGSGHGKSASYEGLQERHAKLAIGSCITLVNFLWDSYKRRNDKS